MNCMCDLIHAYVGSSGSTCCSSTGTERPVDVAGGVWEEQ